MGLNLLNGLTGVKMGCKTGLNGAKQGQMGQNRAKWGETGPNGVLVVNKGKLG